jgi:hypothetical protein
VAPRKGAAGNQPNGRDQRKESRIVKPKALVAPFAKTQWAKTRIQQFDSAVKAFFQNAPYEIVSEVNPKSDEEIWRFQLTEQIPPEFSIMVGEILHSLRSALDNMISEIAVTIMGAAPNARTAFPFGIKNRNTFEAELTKQKKFLPADAISMIRRIKPYPRGNKHLMLLHLANIRDKHRMGLVPINLRTAGNVSYLSLWYGQALVLGSKSGQHLICERRITDADYIRCAVERKVWGCYSANLPMDLITGLPLSPNFNGTHISFENFKNGSAKKSFEFFTATPGTKIKTDFEPAFDVAFDPIWGFERERTGHVLHQAVDLVDGILLTFEKRFFP